MSSHRPARPALALLLALLTALVGVFVGAPPAAAAPPASELERAVQPLRDLDVPGWTVLMTDRDGTRTRLTHGAVEGRPVTGSTSFLVGSIAKPFTATLVAQLVRQGTVRLDRPVRDYLPEFTLAAGRGHDITVRQLLAHTSGLSPMDGLTRSEVVDDRPDTLQRLMRSLREAEPVAEPGAEHKYSSANYLVLGAMVERLTGQPFREVLTQKVIRPLGMTHAVTSPATAQREHLSSGYRYTFGTPRAFDHPYVSSGLPYGYLGASADDLSRFARFQAGQLAAPDVLPADEVAKLHRPQTRTGSGHYGQGWSISTFDGLNRPVIHHTGATPGTFAHLLIDPASGRTVIVLANAYSEAVAPTLAGVGPDLLRAAENRPLHPQSNDPLLTWAPWILVALAAIGVVVAGLGVRAGLAPRRRRRWTLAIGTGVAVLLAIAAAALPGLFGLGWRELRIWFPDVAVGATAVGIAWVIAGLVLIVVLARRAHHRAEPEAAPVDAPDHPVTVGS